MQLNQNEYLINNNNTSRVVLSGLSLNTLNQKQVRAQQTMVQQTSAQQLQQLILQQQLINESVCDLQNPNNQQQAAAAARYKTELCRSFQENGTCKYGEKCQFAHGYHELRSMMRHPKYKTELCRTFHAAGYCPYGPRCHFVHESPNQLKIKQSPIKKQQENATNSLLMCASDSLSREFGALSFTDQLDPFGLSSFSLSSIGVSSSSSSSGISSRKESTSSSSSSTEISPRSLSPDHFGGSHVQFGQMNSFGLDCDDYEPSTQLLVNQILNNINYL